jgi:TRAP-type uncharacterized transport system substrate-binding protein
MPAISQRSLFLVYLIAFVIGLFLHTGVSHAQGSYAERYQEEKEQANLNTVTIIGSGTKSPYTKFAEDLQSVLDDLRTNELRVLPILGRGGGQNLLDVLFLKGIDMGVIEDDAPAYFQNQDPILFSKVYDRVHYITKLANSEFHLFARKEITSPMQLRGKKVNGHRRFSSSHIVAETVFNLLEVDVEITHYDADLAMEKLKNGEIDALVRKAAAPHKAFAPSELEGDQRFHFVPIDESTVGEEAYERLMTKYLPAQLPGELYPHFMEPGETAPTVSSSMLLATYAWPEGTDRYRRVSNFVEKFFNSIQKLRDGPYHPKWKEINLAAKVPGWTRFKAAQEWLDQRQQESTAEIETAFQEFLSERPDGGTRLSEQERAELFSAFLNWWQTRRLGATGQ